MKNIAFLYLDLSNYCVLQEMDSRNNYSKSSTPSSSKNSHVVTTWSHEWLIEDFFRREEAVGSAIQTKFAVAVLDNKNTKFETVWRVKL